MSAVDERQTIGNLFDQHWAGRTPVEWPNTKFDPVEGMSYVRFHVVRGNADRLEFGSDRKTRRQYGRVIVQVLVPRGTGDRDALVLCDQIEAIFRTNGQLTSAEGRLLFREPVSRPLGSEGAFHQHNVSIPYLYDSL